MPATSLAGHMGHSGHGNCPRQPHCALKFGVGYGKGAEQEAALRAADYVTIWLGSHSRKHGNGFNPYWHGRMLDLVRERNVTAVYYAYIIAKLILTDFTKGHPSSFKGRVVFSAKDMITQSSRFDFDFANFF